MKSFTDHNYRVDLYKLVTVGLVIGKNYLPLTGSNEWIRVQKTPEMILSLKSVVEPAESREVYLALTDLSLVSNHFSYVCYTHIKCLGRSLRKIKCQINLIDTFQSIKSLKDIFALYVDQQQRQPPVQHHIPLG